MLSSIPLVSIVVPVYNAEKFIAETIQSVLNQSYKNWELILVDDCSIDESINIIKDFQKTDQRIRVLSLDKNSGVAAARNKGVCAAKGRFIAFLDADDLWSVDKLDLQVSTALESKAVFVFSGYEFGDENGVPVGIRVVTPHVITYEQYLMNNIIWTSTVLLDTRTVKKKDIIMPNLTYGEDALTWIHILKKYGNAIAVPTPLAVYRRTAKSLSANKLESTRKKVKLYWSMKDIKPMKRILYCAASLTNAAKKRAISSQGASKKLSIQTLVATMHQEDHKILNKMNIHTDTIVVNQCDSTSYEEFESGGNRILFMSLPERGVGLNRNTALMRADADIVVFADDDVRYTDSMKEDIITAFENELKADILMFNVPSTNKMRPSPIALRKMRIRRYNCLRYGTFLMAARLDSLQKANIYFSLLFGGGARYSSGEDSLFIWTALKRKLKIYAVPIQIGTVSHAETTWFKGYTNKFFEDKGALFYSLSRNFYIFLIIQFLIRKRDMGNQSFTKKLFLMLKGVKDFKGNL